MCGCQSRAAALTPEQKALTARSRITRRWNPTRKRWEYWSKSFSTGWAWLASEILSGDTEYSGYARSVNRDVLLLKFEDTWAEPLASVNYE